MTPPIWLGATQTGSDLEHLPLPWFRNAIDRLIADTVPESYWRKVVEGREQAANPQVRGVQLGSKWPRGEGTPGAMARTCKEVKA